MVNVKTGIVCLAAGRGTRLQPLTNDRPKGMVELRGVPLIEWQRRVVDAVGIDRFTAVVGYEGHQIENLGIPCYRNQEFETTEMVRSLWCAEPELEGDVTVSYADIVYEADLLDELLASNHPISVVVDRAWKPYWEARFDDPTEDAESLDLDGERIQSIGQPVTAASSPDGQYVGLLRFQGEGVEWLKNTHDQVRMADRGSSPPLGASRSLDRLHMTDLLQGIIDMGYPVHAVTVDRGWVEIDTSEDLSLAEQVLDIDESGLPRINRPRATPVESVDP